MGNNTSVTKHTSSDAVALGEARTSSTAWFSTVFGGILLLGAIAFLIAALVPSDVSCYEDSDCDINDSCNKDRNICNKKKRNLHYLIGFATCLILGILFGVMGIHSFKMLHNKNYLRGVGEGIYQQQALNRTEAPYLAAGAAGAMIMDGFNNNYN
jgi:hypothetical protein